MVETCGSFTAAMFVKVEIIIMLQSYFFLPGISEICEWRSDINLTVPKEMEALAGSCLHIPCSFTPSSTFNSQKQLVAIWIKNQPSFQVPENIIFRSSETENAYPMNMIGILKEKNCTTLFSNLTKKYTDTYYFRIESVPFKASAFCYPLRINVKDSPPKPWIEFSNDDLKENQTVTISCSASTPCPHSPPKLTWNLQQDSPTHTEKNTDGRFTTKIQQTITLSHRHDGNKITCSATYPVDGEEHVKTSETRETLSVSYAPKNTSVSISPSGLVPAGSLVKLSCSSRANPTVSSFTWFKNTTKEHLKIHEGQVYSFEITKMDEIKMYYCVAANVLGKQASLSHLNAEGSSDGNVPWEAILGGTIVILLLAVGFCVVLYWRKTKSDNSNVELEIVSNEVLADGEKKMKTEQVEEETLHYGEMTFSKRTPDQFADSARQGQDTVYAQVNVSYNPSV